MARIFTDSFEISALLFFYFSTPPVRGGDSPRPSWAGDGLR